MFDPTKPVQTRDGRKARIIYVDLNCASGNLVTIVTEEDGGEDALLHFSDGRYLEGHTNDNDLVNVPEKVVGWLSIYDAPDPFNIRHTHNPLRSFYPGAVFFDTKAEADAYTKVYAHCIACVKVEFERP